MAEDSYLEVALADPAGAGWAASAVFAIRKLDPQDGTGQFALVDLVGASLPDQNKPSLRTHTHTHPKNSTNG